MAFNVSGTLSPVLVTIQNLDGTLKKEECFHVAPRVGDFIQTKNETLVVITAHHVLRGMSDNSASYIIRVEAITE